jgi:hypothetical protein
MTHDNKNIHKMVRQVNGCHDYAPIGLTLREILRPRDIRWT